MVRAPIRVPRWPAAAEKNRSVQVVLEGAR
ncbi:hypothetical protein FHU33_0028 [Blastococcus colisei]|uniref:Uncharacterized protein n=1 Tax=Blastococcus colisei TaxID=1564162 RepID=A0A543P9B0_9ACTN|nr:hypothetical protein FHU33_0028 [Blastococcus colisei]